MIALNMRVVLNIVIAIMLASIALFSTSLATRSISFYLKYAPADAKSLCPVNAPNPRYEGITLNEENGYFRYEHGEGYCEVVVWRSTVLGGDLIVFNEKISLNTPWGFRQRYISYLFDGGWKHLEQVFPAIARDMFISLYSRLRTSTSQKLKSGDTWTLFLEFPRYGQDVKVYFLTSTGDRTLIGTYRFINGKFRFIPRGQR
ncbi:MAG: hypothetical protein C4332_13595 [Meiothermus sp.]